jgi:uncharacterized protein YqfA (UPF0365 family)
VFIGASQFAALVVGDALVIGGIAVAVVAALVGSLVLFHYGTRWIQGYMSGADVRMMSLIGMSFHRVKPSMIVTAKIMGRQAGLNIDRDWGMSTARLESHFLVPASIWISTARRRSTLPDVTCWTRCGPACRPK